MTLREQHSKLNRLIGIGQAMALEAGRRQKTDYSFTLPKADFETWMGEINTFNERYLKKHPQHNSIHTAFFHRKNLLDHCEKMVGLLQAVSNDSEFWCVDEEAEPKTISSTNIVSKEHNMLPVVFISHRTVDGPVADMLRDYLVGSGIPNEYIFCSSLPGNDVRHNIPREVKERIFHSTVNIAILSKDYYDSAYCVNEAGIIWLHDHTPTIVIGLPEITPSNMQGFLNNDYKLRRLDNVNDTSEIYDTVQSAVSASQVSVSVITAASQKLVQRYTEHISKRGSKTPEIASVIAAVDELTTDDERVVMYYILTEKVRRVRICDIHAWMMRNEIYNINVDNAFDLLASLGTGKYENGILEMDFNVFRKYTSSADEYTRALKPTVEQHKILARDRFIEMWDSGVFTDADKLFVDYIIRFRVLTLGDGWQTEGQIKQIQHWEGMYFLDETLSSNYAACLNQFAENKLIYESAWTEHGNVKEHTLCPSLKNFLFDVNFPYSNELESVREAHNNSLPF